jgi:hypothetical protein
MPSPARRKVRTAITSKEEPWILLRRIFTCLCLFLLLSLVVGTLFFSGALRKCEELEKVLQKTIRRTIRRLHFVVAAQAALERRFVHRVDQIAITFLTA